MYHGPMEKPLTINELLWKLRAQRGLLPAQDSLLDQLARVRQVCAAEGVKGREEAQVAVALGAYDAADYLAQGERREMEAQRYLATKR